MSLLYCIPRSITIVTFWPKKLAKLKMQILSSKIVFCNSNSFSAHHLQMSMNYREMWLPQNLHSWHRDWSIKKFKLKIMHFKSWNQDMSNTNNSTHFDTWLLYKRQLCALWIKLRLAFVDSDKAFDTAVNRTNWWFLALYKEQFWIL